MTITGGRAASIAGALLLASTLAGMAAAAGAAEESHAQARFRGAPTYDFEVTNVKWEAATKDYSYVTFDLSWSYSWRAKWVEPAATSCTGKDMEVESWDAAWVFVKFLPEKDSKASVESNLWRHASLDVDPTRHTMSAGATNTVGLSDDGKRGVGVFIFRDSIGHGVNDFKGVKLRWLTGADPSAPLGAGKVDPAKAAVKVMAIPMVYVPAGAFKLGSGIATRIAPFSDGPNLPALQGGPDLGSFTDGSWRGGPVVPFLVDAEWDAPAAAGSRARRIGAVAGELWGLGGYVLHCNQGYNIPHACSIGLAGTLNDDYPTGYEAFYCMKYQVTQGQYVEFLNSLPRETAAMLATVPNGEFFPQAASPYPWEGMGLTITDPARIKIGNPKKNKPPEVGEELPWGDDASDLDMMLEKPKQAVVESRPVYAARLPNRTCNYLDWQDGYAFAAWAGLRPMTELEFEKACRGASNPVPGEHAWGSAEAIAGTNRINGDLPTERYLRGNYHGWESGRLWSERATRAGIFATPESDRFQAGATYWGILDMDVATFAVSAASTNDRTFAVSGVTTNLRPFRGSHGDGRAPSSRARGASLPPDWIPPGGRMGTSISQRSVANIASERPPTYPTSGDHRSNRATWRGVRSAAAGKRSAVAAAPAKPGTAGVRTGTRTNTADWDIAHDNIKVGDVKWEPGSAQYSTVTCDIEWENSWRAKWMEPAQKNVTGKPLQVESWDAAWVFLKFRNPGDKVFSHAMLSTVDSDHTSPAGATLSVGLSDDAGKGLGVFVYRAAAGVGANAFKGIKLRWRHSAAGASTPPGADHFDPAKAELVVHAIPMVYVPGGPFQTKGPWGHPLTLISSGDATRPGGHRLEPAPFVSMCWDAETDAAQMKSRYKAGAVPKSDTWPNGYRAFYCTKYSITQGQYADFLNDQGGRPWDIYKFNRYTIRFLEDQKRFVADVPERLCNHLSWGDIFAYTAWAGLRPLTDMEYEKACRGPRVVARAEDAWSAAACARADGLEKVNLAAGSPVASYWGIRELSLTGIPFEWPLTFHNELGLVFEGTHGNGTPQGREDWMEVGDSGQPYEDRMGWGTQLGVWIDPSDVGFIPMGHLPGPFGDRTGRYGVHVGRTAPTLQNEDSPLQVTHLPDMTGYDVGIFHLAGSFRNEGAQPVKVDVDGLPGACFVEGAASRVFTAKPRSNTPFRILVALTGANAATAVRADNTFPVRIRAVGGKVLAEQSLLLAMRKAAGNVSSVASLDGGAIKLRVFNATDRPVSAAVVLRPVPEIKPAESSRRVKVAAGKAAVVAFPVSRQWFPKDGPCRIPYRVTIGSSAPLAGETAVELKTQTRWWITKRVDAGLQPGEENDGLGLLAEVLISDAGDVFSLAAPAKGWQSVTCGPSLPLGEVGPLPARFSKAIGATRAIAAADAEVVIDGTVLGDSRVPHSVCIWVNDAMAFDSHLPAEDRATPVRLRKGANTVVVEWQSNADGETTAENVLVHFNDAKTGEPLRDLLFDMEDGREAPIRGK